MMVLTVLARKPNAIIWVQEIDQSWWKFVVFICIDIGSNYLWTVRGKDKQYKELKRVR